MTDEKLLRHLLYRGKVELILDELGKNISLQIGGSTFKHSEESKKTLQEAIHFFIHGEEGLALDMAFWFIVKHLKQISINTKELIDDFFTEFEADGTYLGKEIVTKYYDLINEGKIYVNTHDTEFLHDLSMSNFKYRDSSEKCGCFYCLRIYDASILKKEEQPCEGEDTWFCKYCGIDSLIFDNFYVVNKRVLERMNKQWF